MFHQMWPLLLCLGVASGAGNLTTMTLINDWTGRLQGEFNIQIPEESVGWEVVIRFSEPVTKMDVRFYNRSSLGHIVRF